MSLVLPGQEDVTPAGLSLQLAMSSLSSETTGDGLKQRQCHLIFEKLVSFLEAPFYALKSH